jgi:long-chain acyl-CoA synthetase
MLVVPNMDNLKAWALGKNLPFADDASLVALPQAGDKLEREVKKELRDLAHFEMPKKVMLLERDFSIESGELTPTLKVKRRVVERNYQGQIEALYGEPPGGQHDI